jgi:hypothetical protein
MRRRLDASSTCEVTACGNGGCRRLLPGAVCPGLPTPDQGSIHSAHMTVTGCPCRQAAWCCCHRTCAARRAAGCAQVKWLRPGRAPAVRSPCLDGLQQPNPSQVLVQVAVELVDPAGRPRRGPPVSAAGACLPLAHAGPACSPPARLPRSRRPPPLTGTSRPACTGGS